MRKTILFLLVFLYGFTFATKKRNVVVFNNNPKKVHIRQVFEADYTQGEHGLDKTYYLDPGQAVFIKDYKTNSLDYYIERESKSFLHEFRKKLTKYCPYEFGLQNKENDLLVVLYPQAEPQMFGAWYSLKRAIRVYDLKKVAGKHMRFFLSTFVNQKIKNVLKKSKENDNQNSDLKRWSQQAQKGITRTKEKLEGLLEAGEKGLSEEMWNLIYGLESKKNDYYSRDGSIKGKVEKKALLKGCYDQLLKVMAQVYCQLHILQLIAKYVPLQIKKKKENYKKEVQEIKDYENWKGKTDFPKTRNVVVFNNNPWNVTLRIPKRDTLLKSGQIMVFDDYDAQNIDYEIIGGLESDKKYYKPYYFKKKEIGDQDLFVILYQGFKEDDGFVKKTRRHLNKVKELPSLAGDIAKVGYFITKPFESPYKFAKRSIRLYGQESFLKEFSYKRSRKEDEYLKNRKEIRECKLEIEVNSNSTEFPKEVSIQRLKERKMFDKKLERQVRRLQTCETVLQDIYTVFKVVFVCKQTIEKKYSKIVSLAAKKEDEKDSTDVLGETLSYAAKTKEQLSDIIIKWMRDKELLYGCYIDVIRFFERRYQKEYYPQFKIIKNKKREYFLPGLEKEIKNCFALCLLLQKRTTFLKKKEQKKNSGQRKKIFI